MTHDPMFAWVGLLALGSLHGINPAMGWLFAVSLGIQERSRAAVWRSLAPLAVGHALAIVAAVGVASLLGRVIPLRYLVWIVAVLLVAFGLAHLTRHRHPRWGGMRVGGRDLTIWSFLMASAHGAGLMALPFLMEVAPMGGQMEHAGTGSPLAAGVVPEWATGLLGTVVHTGGYLLVTGIVAVVVYEWVGLRLLRKAWINLDVLWAVALVATGLLTPFL